MIENRDITSFVNRVFSSSRGHSDRKIMHPDREWFWVTILFSCIFFATLTVSILQYQELQSLPDTIKATESTPIPHYNTALVNELVKNFSLQQEIFQQRLGSAVLEQTPVLENATSSDFSLISDDEVEVISTENIFEEEFQSDDEEDVQTPDADIVEELPALEEAMPVLD